MTPRLAEWLIQHPEIAVQFIVTTIAWELQA